MSLECRVDDVVGLTRLNLGLRMNRCIFMEQRKVSKKGRGGVEVGETWGVK